MSVGTRPDLTAMDDRVYEYVVKQHGEISLSQASADLGISADELKKSTERLKKKGRLG
jgi:predicted ArsR family transcriptional regulator